MPNKVRTQNRTKSKQTSISMRMITKIFVHTYSGPIKAIYYLDRIQAIFQIAQNYLKTQQSNYVPIKIIFFQNGDWSYMEKTT